MGKRLIAAIFTALFIFILATAIALVVFFIPMWLKLCLLFVLFSLIVYYLVKL